MSLSRVRRMHDSIMILDALSCKSIPHIHKRNSAHAVWLRSVPAVAAAYLHVHAGLVRMAPRSHLPLVLKEEIATHVKSWAESEPYS
jgi:hypothetical protein